MTRMLLLLLVSWGLTGLPATTATPTPRPAIQGTPVQNTPTVNMLEMLGWHAMALAKPTPTPRVAPKSTPTPGTPGVTSPTDDAPITDILSGQALTPMPIFRYPVVADAVISGFFDHDPASQAIRFFDGRQSEPGAGFWFSCPAVGDAWVGCEDAATDEVSCDNTRELWYDNHRGIDYEYATAWHTGDTCDLEAFDTITVTVEAPAAGIIDLVEENHPYNGNYIRLYHDLDGNGNYYDDGFRSYFLHFAPNGILVAEGDIVAAGDELGYGGATGLAWTPHLHFEVQQRTELGWVSVDPFGWLGPEEDPWYAPSSLLWQVTP